MLTVCVLAVTVSCVLSKQILVPMSHSCQDEINSKKFQLKNAKHDFVLYTVKEQIQNKVILRNQQRKEEERKRQLMDGIEERDIILEADADREQIA